MLHACRTRALGGRRAVGFAVASLQPRPAAPSLPALLRLAEDPLRPQNLWGVGLYPQRDHSSAVIGGAGAGAGLGRGGQCSPEGCECRAGGAVAARVRAAAGPGCRHAGDAVRARLRGRHSPGPGRVLASRCRCRGRCGRWQVGRVWVGARAAPPSPGQRRAGRAVGTAPLPSPRPGWLRVPGGFPGNGAVRRAKS